jgi:hypothetical protein
MQEVLRDEDKGDEGDVSFREQLQGTPQDRGMFCDVSEEVTSRFMTGTQHHLRSFLSQGVVCDRH